MSANKLMGFEDVDVDGKTYVFRSNFDFLVEVKADSGVDPIRIYNCFQSDEADPSLVLSVLTCSLVSVSGVPVIPDDREKICKDLVDLKGYQEAVILCSYMMNYAMIGDKKKSQITSREKTQMLLDQLSPSPLKNFRNHLLLWGYVMLISGICVCINIKLQGLLTAYSTG